LRIFLRSVLILAMAVSAGAKLVAGHHPGLPLSAPVFYAAIGIEVSIAALLIFGKDVPGSIATVVLCAVGIVWTLLSHSPSCGCLGNLLELDRNEHLMYAGSVGVVGALLWLQSVPGPDPGASARDARPRVKPVTRS